MPEVANIADFHSWNGYTGRHWAANAGRYEALFSEFNEPLLEAARISRESDIVDIGCGNGNLTCLAAQRAHGGSALGLDLSGPMLDRGRAYAVELGLDNVTFAQGDAQVHPFEPESFDTAISRFGVMFFSDPVRAFANIAGAVSVGGSVAFVCPSRMEDQEFVSVVTDLIRSDEDRRPPGHAESGPFSLGDSALLRWHLTEAGLAEISVDRIDSYQDYGTDAAEAARFYLHISTIRYVLQGVSGEVEAGLANRVAGAFRRLQRTEQAPIRLGATAWLVSARRR